MVDPSITGFPHTNGIHTILKHDNIPEPHYLSSHHAFLSYKNDVLKNIGHRIISKDAALSPASGSEDKVNGKYHLPVSKYSNSSEKPYRCEICKKNFSQQSNLHKHNLIHMGLKPHTCENCGKRFTQQANLIKHKRIHTGDKPYTCDICLRQFSQNANLKKHMQLHTGEKRYSCEFCQKPFVQQANLDRHRRTHTGEKPFSCHVCQKRFTQKGNLVKHEVIHLLKEGQRNAMQFRNKLAERGSIDSLLGISESSNQSNSTENYSRRISSIPMVLTGKDGMYLKRY